MKINIAKAMKIKNRIAKRVSDLREIIRKENCKRSDQTKAFDLQAIYDELIKETANLCKIKSLISQHSVGVCDKLVELSESKGELAWLRTLSATNKTEKIAYGDTVETYTWDSFLDVSEISKLINSVQDQCNLLQDEIDEYNAMTTFDWS